MREEYVQVDLEELKRKDPEMAKVFVLFFREYNTLRSMYDSLNRKYIKLQTMYNILQSENKRLSAENDVLKAHLSRLTDRYNKAVAEKNNLRLEYEEMKMKKGMAELAKQALVDQLEELYVKLSDLYLSDPITIAREGLVDSVNAVLGMIRAVLKELKGGGVGATAQEAE